VSIISVNITGNAVGCDYCNNAVIANDRYHDPILDSGLAAWPCKWLTGASDIDSDVVILLISKLIANKALLLSTNFVCNNLPVFYNLYLHWDGQH
jgi:hypothetical protein